MTSRFSEDGGPPALASLAGLGASELRRVLEVVPAGAYTCDTQGLITYFNRHAEALWGRAPRLNDPVERYTGALRLYDADGAPVQADACWMALALHDRRENLGQEIVIERPDGRRLTALAHASPFYDEKGELLGAVSVFVDVTDRSRTDVVQARLAAIVESSDDAIVGKSLDGIITSWNTGAERLFGYTAEEAIGQSILLVIPPERAEEERTILARLRRGERIEHFETVRVAKDGRMIDISITVSPIHDARGRVIGASKVARDITARKAAERALVELKDELAEQVSDLGRLHEMSALMATTLETPKILQVTLRTAAAIEDTDAGLLWIRRPDTGQIEVGASMGLEPEHIEALRPVPAPGEASPFPPRRIVIENIDQDSLRNVPRRARFRSVHSTPLVTRTGQVLGVLSTYFRQTRRPTLREMNLIDVCVRQAVDFLENARLYEELRVADRRKEEFLAILSHELRNPLAPLRNALELQRRDGANPDTLVRTRSIMERQVEQLVRLVDDLMDTSRISRGKLVLRRQATEFVTIVENAIESVRPMLKGHTITTLLTNPTVYLDADRARLEQVFSNLLSNAVKYSPQGGPIEIVAEREGPNVLVVVRDHGIGIEPEMLPRVFDLFKQVEDAVEHAQGGLGIGLTLVRGLVHLHGGTIEARSEGLGKGSEFAIRLPVLMDWKPESGPIGEGSAEGAAAGPGGLRILVVEDNRDSATSLGMMLELMGNEVRLAHDGEAAVQAAEEYRPDVVLTDIGLPKLNGYQVARAIRGKPWGRQTFLVAITGWGQDEDKRRTAEAGFNVHVTKPLAPGRLESLLSKLVSRRTS